MDAMAAAKFLTESADTPGVKHLLHPMTLHIGALDLQHTERMKFQKILLAGIPR
jgi:hypothetical protein